MNIISLCVFHPIGRSSRVKEIAKSRGVSFILIFSSSPSEGFLAVKYSLVTCPDEDSFHYQHKRVSRSLFSYDVFKLTNHQVQVGPMPNRAFGKSAYLEIDSESTARASI